MANLKRFFVFFTTAALAALFLSGCGGGGSSSGSKSTKGKGSLKTAGLVSSGLLVGGLDVVISIPYGVTVELDPATNKPARSVVTLVGTADPKMTMESLQYVAATPTTKGSLRIVYLNSVGFTPADSLSIWFDITTGFFPQAIDFALTKFEIATMTADGSTINSPLAVQNPVFTAEII